VVSKISTELLRLVSGSVDDVVNERRSSTELEFMIVDFHMSVSLKTSLVLETFGEVTGAGLVETLGETGGDGLMFFVEC